jgi:hypothetical protein
MLDWKGLLFPSYGRMSKFYPDHSLMVQQMRDRIRKFLKKKGLDDLTIEFATMGYGYFDLDKRGKRQISKMAGRTIEEDTELYNNVLLFCCQYKDFAELIIQDKKQAAEVHRMASAISWEASEQK